MTPMDTPPTKRATVRQKPQRAHYDRETVNAILDEGLVCHVGFIVEGAPIVIPTGYARVGDRLLLHGGAASRLMGQLGEGVEVSIAVTIVDGLVLADVAFRHSMNYRSVVLFGRARAITDPVEKQRALRAFAEHMVPGRWSDLPAPTPQELGATAVVEVPIDEVSAKIRSGPPIAGASTPAPTLWTGTASFATSVSGFTPEARSEALPVPEYLTRWRRGAGII
jgi:nitroimidazol reductase NimA-like FMN-containing flavoprotein (pyridoxamine 5'-phosphate oxidase superfamily)